MKKRYAAFLAALLAAAIALGLVKDAPKVEPEFPVSSPMTRGFGTPCDTSDFSTVVIFGQDRTWNKGAILPLRAALELARARSDYAPSGVGTYACRRIAGSSTWSHHAWALAVDFDPGANSFGTPVSDTRIGGEPEFYRAFEAVGFVWGGRWRTPDAMHFEWDGPKLRNEQTLAPGARGPAVRRLEGLLRAVGLPVKVDRRYARKDLLSVVAFQKKNGFLAVEMADVGPLTWTLLKLEAA